MADLYDVEAALRQLARHRRRNDRATTAQVGIADQLATGLTRHFPDGERLEAAGTALVVAGASLASLAAQGLAPNVLVNIVAFAGQRMTLDARAGQPADGNDGHLVAAATRALGDIAATGARMTREPARVVPLAEAYAAVEWGGLTPGEHRAALVNLAGNVLARLIDLDTTETTGGQGRT